MLLHSSNDERKRKGRKSRRRSFPYLGQSLHSWRNEELLEDRYSSLIRRILLHFFSSKRERGKIRTKEGGKGGDTWNERMKNGGNRDLEQYCTDPTPTISSLYRRQRTFTRNGTQLVSLGESSRAAKVPGSFHFVREIEDPSIHWMHSSRPISRVREARKASQTVGTVGSREMILERKKKKNYSNY